MRTIKTILLSFMTLIALSAHAQDVAGNDRQHRGADEHFGYA